MNQAFWWPSPHTLASLITKHELDDFCRPYTTAFEDTRSRVVYTALLEAVHTMTCTTDKPSSKPMMTTETQNYVVPS
uniref:Uncharacterized protein n=1 Tax=Trichuris muris TaxID=70415 RepID=A0A5S6QIG5_TRIMR